MLLSESWLNPHLISVNNFEIACIISAWAFLWYMYPRLPELVLKVLRTAKYVKIVELLLHSWIGVIGGRTYVWCLNNRLVQVL